MKKVFTIAAFIAVSATATFAQRVVGAEVPGKAIAKPVMMDKADTTLLFTAGISNPTGAGCDSLTVYGIPNNGGYVTGFNQYGDLQKAAVFTGSGSVLAVVAQVAGKAAAPGFENADFAATISTVNLTDSSFTTVGTSVAVPLAAIDDSTGGFTIWPMTAPAAVSGTWAASVEVGQYSPTSIEAGIILFGTREDCGNGDLAWEQFNDGTWVPMSVSWPIEIEVAIGVAVSNFASNPESDLISGVLLFPNPVQDQFNLTYTSAVSGSVRIDIIDATGRVVKVVSEGSKAAGTYVSTISTGEFASGFYTYRITMGGKQAQGKFMVN